MSDQPVYVRIPEELVSELQELIAGRPGNRSDHIRQAVREYVERLRLQRQERGIELIERSRRLMDGSR